MEGQSSNQIHNNSMQMMPFNFYGNNTSTVNDVVSHVTEDVGIISQHNIDLMGSSGRISWGQNELSLRVPWWINNYNQTQEASQNYVKFLAETSAFLPLKSDIPSEDMILESDSFPDSTGTHAVSEVSDFKVNTSYNHLGQACGSSTRSTEMDARQLRFRMPHNEDMESRVLSTQHQIHPQSHTYWTQTSDGDSYSNDSRADVPSTRNVASPGSRSQPHPTASKRNYTATDRQRRMRIADRLNALRELLPYSTKGCQESILDDLIDHIKYLQLQIKDLCKRRLEGESVSDDIIFHEGFGHYFCRQQMSNEPLEEMIGKLLELNPLEAIQLLEMKGLLLMPIEFSQGLV